MSGVTFMPHQIEAINRLSSGSILCGGVGTGKSITAIGYFYICECGGVVWKRGGLGPMTRPKPLYIITTARKRDTKEWDAECERFDLKDETSIVVDSWNNIKKYDDVADAFFIFDEQRVVGSGKWVKSFIKIAKVNHWILLSATPGDTWMDYIPVFVANGFYKNRTQFLRRHAVYNRYTRYPKVDRWMEIGYLESLRRKITVTMEYHKKTVPHWEDIFVDYDLKNYKRVAEDRWNIFDNEPIQEISMACYLMRKVVNSDERRMEAVRKIISENSKKAIIFYNYDYELEMLRTLSDSGEYEYGEWNGHRHDTVPTGEKWVYLVQYMAGAEGWNCTTTDTIIFFSQNYSYKLMTQAAGRIDRLNTPFTDLYYYVLKSKAPIDMAIGRALKGKKTFNEKNFVGSLYSEGSKHVLGNFAPKTRLIIEEG